MSTTNKKPVTSIKYQKEYDGTPGYSRVSIPDSSHQGEEAMAIDGMPEKSQYDVFRHEFKRGMDPELYRRLEKDKSHFITFLADLRYKLKGKIFQILFIKQTRPGVQ